MGRTDEVDLHKRKIHEIRDQIATRLSKSVEKKEVELRGIKPKEIKTLTKL